MFTGHTKYFDAENLEELIETALEDDDFISKLTDMTIKVGEERIDLGNKLDEAIAELRKLEGQEERLQERKIKSKPSRARAEEEPGDDDVITKAKKHAEKIVEDIRKSLDACIARHEAQQRAEREARERKEKEDARLNKAIRDMERIINKHEQDKTRSTFENYIKNKDEKDLLRLHFDILSGRLPTSHKQLLLETVDAEISRRQGGTPATKPRQKGAKSENVEPDLPPSSRRTAVDEAKLSETYIKARRSAQDMESDELKKAWALNSPRAAAESATMADFLPYKAVAHEFHARYRIAERGFLDQPDDAA